MAITDRLREEATQTTGTTKRTIEQLLSEPKKQELSEEEAFDKEIELYSALMFWYGMSLEQCLEYPVNLLRKLIEHLPKHLGDLQRMLILAGTFAYMDKKDQDKVRSQLDQADSGSGSHDPKQIDLKKLSPVARKHFFKSQGIAFEQVPASQNGGGE